MICILRHLDIYLNKNAFLREENSNQKFSTSNTIVLFISDSMNVSRLFQVQLFFLNRNSRTGQNRIELNRTE